MRATTSDGGGCSADDREPARGELPVAGDQPSGRGDGNRRRRLVAIALIVAVGAISAVSVAAGRGPSTHDPEVHGSMVDGSPLTVSALEASPGETLHVAGHGCTLAAGTGVPTVHVWFSPAPGTVEWQPSFGEPVDTVAPDSAGSWSASVVVPEAIAPYRLEAACLDGAQPPEGFVYARALVTVG